MKHQRLSLILFAVFILIAVSSTLFAQGGVLAPNGSGSGSLSEVTTNEWWQITTTVDGALEVTTTSDATLEVDLFIFNSDQSVQLASYDISTGTIEKTHHNSLGPGTYWVRAKRWSGAGSYTIQSQFTPTSYDTDFEVNDTFSQAVVLTANGSDTGHLYHYYDGTYDANDWWKVTVPQDGRLLVTTVSDSTLEVDLFTMDVDGETQLASYDISTGITETTHHNSLTPGTYYVRAKRWSGYGAYTITSEFTPSALDNDTENNDSTAVAQVLPVNGSDTGHLGYYSAEKTDLNDYWAVTVPGDGNLIVSTVSDSTLEVDLFIIDDNGETQIASYDISSGINETTHYNGLTPGTYFVRARRWSGYGSYTITSDFTPTLLSNDAEPNDEVTTASAVTNLFTQTGHLGHYDSGSIDAGDYFMVTVPVEWDTLYVRTVSDSTLELDIIIYGAGGVAQVAYGGRSGIEEWAYKANPAETTYWIKMRRWSGYGSYSFIVSNSTAAQPGEQPIAVEQTDAPAAFQLAAPYPNPFNPTTTVSFVIPEAGHTRLTVYDILGREVAELVDDYLSAGAHSMVWHARDAAGQRVGTGMYLFKLEAGAYVGIQKATLMR